MNSVKLALIGECMIELQEIAPSEIRQTFGGDTLNTAIYCARLAQELPLKIDYVTALGTDSFSEKMMRFWENEGVGSDLVIRQDGESPGLYYIEVDDSGERIFHYWRSTSAAKKCFEYPDSDEILKKLNDYDGIYLSGISMAVFTPESRKKLLDRLSILAQAGTSLYYDLNYRPHLWDSRETAVSICRQLCQISDIVFLTTEEAHDLLEETTGKKIHQMLARLGTKESVLKDGEKPCTIFTKGEMITVAAEKVAKVVDTTAAGDSFSAVYLVARKFGCTPRQAAAMAHKTAAYVVCHKGAVAPLDMMTVSGKDIDLCSHGL